ncbi:MAG: hypothetical protein KJ970_17865 [Candidatus Eisenbacteria bacterium]|uniref:Uncharacterized protein n=1 Tax=Eiseniibacteriota bacterium TaxID=2212470 RepID=A0A948S003_UNCEI|nr:hypothetical protein [Candidatus Eisenbacteria bacterium]MBU1950823.1 hypothetical protein [Candidatus Eisenbacteria bacterium]MBU2692788.1 hypothetical protein [Candidatus Eisenbacteria bacterium]
MDATWADLAWQGVAALLTLAVFSFLFGDNPIYKFAERLWVGIATGYWTMLLYHQGLHDKVILPIFQQHHWYYIIPVLMGILMWFRLSPKHGYLSRYALGFYVGISTGIYIPLAMKTAVFLQVEGTISQPPPGLWASICFFLSLVGIICSLIYFFFSKPHTGLFGVLSKTGIYTLMIGFGAGFGLTVMGRVALLVQRVIFLRDYVVLLWDKVF